MFSLAFSYRLGHSTVSESVLMVCAAIEKHMMDSYPPRPTTESWSVVAQDFWQKWNFPNCLEALDGKHDVIQAPPLSGSQYFNYKKTFSIVLLALVDADCRFRAIQVADFGRTSDDLRCHVMCVCLMLQSWKRSHSFVMVGDAAFPLKEIPDEAIPRTKPHTPKEDFQLQTFKSEDSG